MRVRPTVDSGSSARESSLFLAATAVVTLVSVHLMALPSNSVALAVATTFDLTIILPALYWFLLVRGRGWRLVTVLPVFVLCLLLASLVVPPDRRIALDLIELLVVPIELAIAWLVVRRVVRMARTGDEPGAVDVRERIRVSVLQSIRNRPLAEAVAFECALLWYALFSWRNPSKPITPESTGGAFTHHRTSGHMAVALGLVLVIVVEAAAVHALLARWSHVAAWAATVLSAYSALWLLGDARALGLRRTSFDVCRLTVRFGLRWSLVVRRDDIESCSLVESSPSAGGEYLEPDLTITAPGARRVRLDFRCPVEAVGVYGITRRIRSLELGVDEPERFVSTLS